MGAGNFGGIPASGARYAFLLAGRDLAGPKWKKYSRPAVRDVDFAKLL